MSDNKIHTNRQKSEMVMKIILLKMTDFSLHIISSSFAVSVQTPCTHLPPPLLFFPVSGQLMAVTVLHFHLPWESHDVQRHWQKYHIWLWKTWCTWNSEPNFVEYSSLKSIKYRLSRKTMTKVSPHMQMGEVVHQDDAVNEFTCMFVLTSVHILWRIWQQRFALLVSAHN